MKIASMHMMSVPEMTRTNVAHLGSAPLRDATALATTDVPAVKKLGTFESYILDAVNAVNEKQLTENRLAKQYITDPDSVRVEDLTLAMAEAQSSLSLAQTVIDRLTTGWNELSTTR